MSEANNSAIAELQNWEADLKEHSDRLFLFRTRAGQLLFHVMDNDGAPTTRELAFVMHRGWDQFPDLKSLPFQGCKLLGNGWGIVAIPLTQHSPLSAVRSLVLAAGKDLANQCSLQPRAMVFNRVRLAWLRMLHKISAFQAA